MMHQTDRTLSRDCDIALIGAGPYGLSAAAHLNAAGFRVRVFGEPMDFWANKMPHGMLLRSPRVASNISDPKLRWTLEAFEAASGTTATAPVPLQTFVNYGRWFQRQLGAALDRTPVTAVQRQNGLFRLTTRAGDSITSRRVVVAAGVGSFCNKPAIFGTLDPEQVSHCYEGRPIADLARKRIAIIGAGQSALESAALLHEAGSKVEVIARIHALRWIGMHSWLHHLGPLSTMMYASHDVGPAGISRLVAYPRVVRHIPLKLKDRIRRRAVRPAGSRWLPPRLTGVTLTTGRSVATAESRGGEVRLVLDDGSERRIDHVLLGTGYRVNLSRYDFLPPDLVSDVRQLDGSPDVGRGFCSSVPGLHFVGATAARCFGPLLYFVAGTEFASRELTSFCVESD